jgi:hypothetical protein
MGNREHRQQRRGNGRPGPIEREREENAAHLKRQRTAERVRRHRAKLKEIAEKARVDHDVPEQQFVRSKCQYIVKKVVQFIEPHLSRCPGPEGRQAVLDRFLRHPSISPHLPSYYLPPKEAAAQKLLIEGLRSDLNEVKGVQSREKLAWKGTILSAVVSKGNEDSIITQGQGRALAKVLNTNRRNIYSAMKRRWDSVGGGSLKWAPLQRIRRTTRIEEETTAAVIHWWNQETRVSPVHKEVVRKRVGPKLYEKHAMHYLLESQVSSLSHEDENVLFIYFYILSSNIVYKVSFGIHSAQSKSR